MSSWRGELTNRLAALKLRPEREAEIVDELTQHLDDHVRELIAGGADPETARTIALAELDQPGELARRLGTVEARSPYALPPPGAPSRARWLSALRHDVSYAMASLRRTPAFTLTVIATMALTIGPTTAMLSVANWLLWRPAPGVAQADRLAVVWFGESLDPDDVSKATDATNCEVFLTIGTSAVVYPAAGLVHQARRRGAFTVEINLEPTDASGVVDVALHGPAAEILATLDRTMNGFQ